MARRVSPFDAATKFCEDLLLAASDVVAAGGNDVVLKLGKGHKDGELIIDVKEIEIASNNEVYTFLLQGCNVQDFTTGTPPIENLAQLTLGATEVRPGGALDSIPGRHRLLFSNVARGAEYEYARLNVIIAGTIATGVKFSAWIVNPNSR